MADGNDKALTKPVDHMRARWEHFHHEADIGIRGIGPDLATALEQAALAMTAVICEPSQVSQTSEIELACEAPDPEFLLVNWIDALVYAMAIRRMLFSDFRVAIDQSRLTARVRGEPINIERHQPAVEIKGATLTGLRVYRDAFGACVAECIVDV
jgi:tRNA nucleotidyltransferase (CCA-adding enzyme)